MFNGNFGMNPGDGSIMCRKDDIIGSDAVIILVLPANENVLLGGVFGGLPEPLGGD
jgi:hypothetical protein